MSELDQTVSERLLNTAKCLQSSKGTVIEKIHIVSVLEVLIVTERCVTPGDE